ncbi:Charged multivesicular body protein 2a [Orchesella cincta]|uniref:Charged multivesicular body protein 2a n=1 Tax=Orchesella cincta TaxID=48709 RepID=A0A1D2MKK0_ORCCI|nr:Charged multivesicular body protein 2a [Orchesella cincta]
MTANIQAVAMKVQTLRSQNAMTEAIRGVTKAMQRMNKQLNLPQITKILQEFEKQSEIMETKEEMMGEVVYDALGGDNDEESKALVAQVLDELGLQIGDQLAALPTAERRLETPGRNQREPIASAVSDVDADLQARLDNLRRE